MRNHSGVNNPNARLTERDALGILRMKWWLQLNQYTIGDLYGIDPSTVSRIANGDRWASVYAWFMEYEYGTWWRVESSAPPQEDQ